MKLTPIETKGRKKVTFIKDLLNIVLSSFNIIEVVFCHLKSQTLFVPMVPTYNNGGKMKPDIVYQNHCDITTFIRILPRMFRLNRNVMIVLDKIK